MYLDEGLQLNEDEERLAIEEVFVRRWRMIRRPGRGRVTPGRADDYRGYRVQHYGITLALSIGNDGKVVVGSAVPSYQVTL